MVIIQAANRVIDQLSGLLDKIPVSQYSKSLPLLNGSSVGQHVRHTLEFFICLFEGIEAGEVDYDARRRDLFLESNTLEAKNCLINISQRLEGLDKDLSLVLIQTYGDEEPIRVESNLQRELIYNIEHAVHHMALIRVGLTEIAPELVLCKDFGVASSTIKYRESLSVSK